MTQPTQAQIEAAENLLLEKYGIAIHPTELADALTAAAQVGGPMKEIKQYEQMISRNKVQSERDNATIERCAQVADRLAVHGVADEIRKLKDAP